MFMGEDSLGEREGGGGYVSPPLKLYAKLLFVPLNSHAAPRILLIFYKSYLLFIQCTLMVYIYLETHVMTCSYSKTTGL